MFSKYLNKISIIIFCTLTVLPGIAIAVSDLSARPSLSANEHFTIAKDIDDLSQKLEEPPSTEAAKTAVWHVEQAIAKGYSGHKQAQLLLQKMLWAWGASKYECFSKFKESKDILIQKMCAPFISANERANNMTPELFRTYPDDPKIAHSYFIYISSTGAGNVEKEAMLRKALMLAKDSHLIAALAYVLVDEKKFEEAKERFAEALELVSDEYVLAVNLEKFAFDLRSFGCMLPADLDQVVRAIPDRYKSEFEKHEHEKNVKAKIKPTKDEIKDNRKLAEIKKNVINGIRQAQCKAPQ